MAIVRNVRRPRLDKEGNVQRVKIKGYLPISFGYGVYLGDSFDDRASSAKVYFLMLSADPNENTVYPQQLISSPSFSGLSFDEFPFSKKFSTADHFVNSFHAGNDYWFTYTSDATTSIIEGKSITYEALKLIEASDLPGTAGLTELVNTFKFPKSNSSQSNGG